MIKRVGINVFTINFLLGSAKDCVKSNWIARVYIALSRGSLYVGEVYHM